MRQQAAAFPVGLYGMLLFALCWLTLPTVFAPLERVLLGATCLLPRLGGAFSGTPAVAAVRGAERIEELSEELGGRLRRQDIDGGRALLPARFEPVFCTVREALTDRRSRGGAGLPAVLRLEETHAELADCAAFVTKGDALLGFLVRAGTGEAADDLPGDPARVQLVHHRSAPPIYAAMELEDRSELRLVVGNAATVDPAPLRADLWSDPYRAARLERGGHVVRTLPIDDGAVAVPAGLQLGRTRIWGYDGRDGDAQLTIGVYVEPRDDPRALSHVVVWRDRRRAVATSDDAAVTAAPTPRELRRRHPATVRDLPGAVHGRHLLIADVAVPDGAAVVQQGIFLGTARGLSFGMGLVTSFTASRQRWSLLLLPDEPGAAARELVAQVVRADGAEAVLQGEAGTDGERLPAGQLFTGSNGPDCPSGLWIGSVEPVPREPGFLVLRTLALPGPRAAEVWIAAAGGAP